MVTTASKADEQIYCFTESQLAEVKRQAALDALALFERRFLEHDARTSES